MRLAALSTAWAWPHHSSAALGERSGSPDRKVIDQAFWSGNLSCDNTAVSVSDRSARLATVADFDSSQSCTMLKNSVEGPFYFCTNPTSADIAQGKAGTPLVVALRAIDAATCRPIANAVIDIWHCDAGGLYSGHDLAVDEAIQATKHTSPSNNERFCRGALRTDADGVAEFRSIYPGYYIERAIHIHFKVHLGNRAYLTNQAHLPEEDNAVVLTHAPYRMPRKAPRIANAAEDWGLPTMKIVQRRQTRLAVLNLALPV
ncbi:MAG: hypothetical protein R3E68_03770 [Burkholderiaceae bacterium]